MNRKKTVFLAAAALVLLMAAAAILYARLEPGQEARQLAASTEETTAKVTAPDFTVYDLEGNAVKLSDFFGKPIVLNFWASWCGPCKSELPDFQKKYEELGENVQFLMINVTDGVQETLESASSFLSSKGYTLPVYYDTTQTAGRIYRVTALPCTYFIDPEGNAVASAKGAIDGDTLQRGIDFIYTDMQ